MISTTVTQTTTPHAVSPWQGFRSGLWQSEINVRDFIQQNYEPYDGDDAFLAPPTARTLKIWSTLEALFVEERKKGVLDVSQIPSSITAHAPGYIDRDNEIIVGLQTDAPLKRAIMPNGGLRLVVNALKAYGYEPDPSVVDTFSKYRKTHNEAVFDAYTADVRRCRSSHILTGLPDAYGRGRIIGDYRRVALYGVNRLIERKQQEKSALDARHSTDDIIRDREELAEQIRALKELLTMAAAYGFDISGPARTAKEAVQWLYFGYLAGVKEQNGAAMSLGRTSTFLDIYFARDLASGTLTEAQAQEIVDDFVIKLRIVRFLRTPEYDELFAGDPTWVTESIGGMGDDGRTLVTKTSFRLLQTLYNLGPAPEPNLTIWYSPRLPDGFRRFAAKVAIDTSSLQFESDEIMRRAWGDDGAIACCVSPMLVGKQMQFFGARANLAKCLLYAINGGRDEISGEQIGLALRRGHGRRARVRRRDRALRPDDGLAGRRLRQRDERHPLHARQVRLRADRDGAARLRAAPDDGVRHGRHVGRRRQPVGDQVREGPRRARRDRADHRLPDRRHVPALRQQRQPRRSARLVDRQHVHEQAAEVPDVPQRGAHAVDPDDYVERRLRQGDGQHAGRAAARASRSRRAPTRCTAATATASTPSAASVAKIPYRDAADGISLTRQLVPQGLGRTAEDRDHEPDRRCSTRSSGAPATT